MEPVKRNFHFFFFFRSTRNVYRLRRWFSLRHGQLLYMKRHHGNATNDSLAQQQSVMVADLRLCTIRPVNDNDRRFVFEILSPNRYNICSQRIFDIQRRFLLIVHIFYKLIHNQNVSNGSMLCKLQYLTHLNLPMEIFTIPHRFVTKTFFFSSISREEKKRLVPLVIAKIIR